MEHAQDELEQALLDGVPDRSHAKHVGVVQQACWAVSCWVVRLGGVQKSIQDAGAEKLVRAAVGGSESTAKTQEQGHRLLHKLAQL